MDVTDCLGNSGPGYSFEHAGRTWTLTRIDQGIKAGIEMWLRQREWQTVREMKDVLSEDKYDALVLETRRKIAAGFFSFTGNYCREALDTLDGKLRLIKQCFLRHHPDITDEQVLTLLGECPDKVEDAMASLHPKEYAAQAASGGKKK